MDNNYKGGSFYILISIATSKTYFTINKDNNKNNYFIQNDNYVINNSNNTHYVLFYEKKKKLLKKNNNQENKYNKISYISRNNDLNRMNVRKKKICQTRAIIFSNVTKNNILYPKGIYRVDEKCIITSLLQCLFYIKEFRNDFINKNDIFRRNNHSLCSSISNVFYGLKYSNQKYYEAKELKKLLTYKKIIMSEVILKELKDFFMFLFDYILTELSLPDRDSKEPVDVNISDKNLTFKEIEREVDGNIITNKLFLGYYETIYKCPNKNNSYIYTFQYQPFILFELEKIINDNKKEILIEDCFNHCYNNKEKQTGFFCNKCNEIHNGKAVDKIYRLPEILVIIFETKKNFNFKEYKIKYGKYLYIKDINNCLDTDYKNKSNYKLVGIIYAKDNYYSSICLADDNKYYCFTDTFVDSVNENELFEIIPCMLFYQRLPEEIIDENNKMNYYKKAINQKNNYFDKIKNNLIKNKKDKENKYNNDNLFKNLYYNIDNKNNNGNNLNNYINNFNTIRQLNYINTENNKTNNNKKNNTVNSIYRNIKSINNISEIGKIVNINIKKNDNFKNDDINNKNEKNDFNIIKNNNITFEVSNNNEINKRQNLIMNITNNNLRSKSNSNNKEEKDKIEKNNDIDLNKERLDKEKIELKNAIELFINNPSKKYRIFYYNNLEKNPQVWKLILIGPDNSPYKYGFFNFKLNFSEGVIPDLAKITKIESIIYHPNIGNKSKNLLFSYEIPEQNLYEKLKKYFEFLHGLLEKPDISLSENYDENKIIINEFKNNYKRFFEEAEFYTKNYAR